MDLLFKLLGWAIAGDKEVQFGSIAKVLGLKVDLSEAHLGRVFMTNTDSRRDEMFETISQILDDDFLPKKKGEQLCGRLQFAECQIAGRTSGMALKLTTFPRAKRRLRSSASWLSTQVKLAKQLEACVCMYMGAKFVTPPHEPIAIQDGL